MSTFEELSLRLIQATQKVSTVSQGTMCIMCMISYSSSPTSKGLRQVSTRRA